jgi:zinc protease
MKTALRSLVLVLGVAACGGAPSEPPTALPPQPLAPPVRAAETAPPPRITPDAPFREKAPAADGSVAFAPPKVESFKLKNGVRVLFVERHDLPIVSVRVVAKGGAGDYDFKPGVASFMGAMLEQGAGKRSALDISDDYEAIGAQHSAGVDWDSGYVAVKVLGQHIDKALEILSDIALRPTFPDGEVDRLRDRRLGGLVQDKKNPGAMAANSIAATVFGRKHPYGHSMTGREDDVKAVKRDALLNAYKLVFSRPNATIVVAGDVTKSDLQSKLEKAFGDWKATGGAAPKAPAAPKENEKEPRLVFVDLPSSTQSQVYLAQPGIPFGSKDRDAVQVMNAILGGTFGSRINMNLREDKAITYGARSRFGLLRGAGSFTAGGSMVSDATATSVHELFNEVNRIRDAEVSESEIAAAKDQLKLALPGRFETVSEITGALEDLAVYDLPLDDFSKRVARIDAVTIADVKRVAASILKPKTMKVVIVGDKTKLGSTLDPLNLGPMDIRDAFGDTTK